jgi:hypothetical protein
MPRVCKPRGRLWTTLIMVHVATVGQMSIVHAATWFRTTWLMGLVDLFQVVTRQPLGLRVATWPACHMAQWRRGQRDHVANYTFRNNQIYHTTHTSPMTCGKQFATCMGPIHVANCKWRIAIFFVVPPRLL